MLHLKVIMWHKEGLLGLAEAGDMLGRSWLSLMTDFEGFFMFIY